MLVPEINTSEKNPRTQEERNTLAKKLLCKAALELFAIKGYDSTSLADIGARAGYSRSLVKYHYGSKLKLAETLIENSGQRDIHTHILKLSDATTGEKAWQCLHDHLDNSWNNFRSMIEGDEDENLASRGEMILYVTATFSQNTELSNKLKEVSNELTNYVNYALKRCVQDGIIRSDIDTKVTAIFYISSIWAMVNALFSAPENIQTLSSLPNTLKYFLATLKIKHVNDEIKAFRIN